MWFKKESKKKNLELRVNQLREKYKNVIKSYCMIGDYIFILIGFELDGDTIKVVFYDSDNVTGTVSLMSLLTWETVYGNIDFIRYRTNYIVFNDKLNRIGIKLVFNNTFR